MKKILHFLFLLSLGACVQQPENLNAAETEPKSSPEYAKVFSTESNFDDVKDNLLFAIEGKGLVVSYTSHAQEMLDRTAEVAGVTTPVYERAEIVLFCKADLSHKLVTANPHNIVLCPYAIAVYSLHGKPDTTYLSFRDLPGNKATTAAIRQLLVDIIEEAM